jgi:alpha-amylase/alpha-mannosidase (GH57 family)
MSERFVCIHGHFYQPPREHPWLEEIQRQESARPYHDWNERVCREAYAPNAFARILNTEGRITRIVNNYARISFNFGPTLLRWMERHARSTYEAVLEADRKSRERFSGHGSALAQAFGHMILPLANSRDKRTQVLWGIHDFETRFGREPDGMWLPETAVDLESLEIMAAAGIRFTILAPRQAAAVRAPDGEEWEDVRGERVDPTRPYRVTLPSGREITVFFYNGGLSREVAFEELLSDGDTLARRLLEADGAKDGSAPLTHIATDGETYGHHHRHGEMALAYALQVLERYQGIRLTNYGEYLSLHPPTWEARVAENSSWSCVHGVERWRSDCGCTTGDHGEWRQAWRAPLRDALDWLRDRLAARFEEAAGQLLEDPWGARDRYVEVVSNRAPHRVDGFLAREASQDLTDAEKVRVLQLLEIQRHAMLMYTSCGWFFDDLARIETLQVLRYAARALHLAEILHPDELERGFLARLRDARSNVPAMGTGADLYRTRVAPDRVRLPKVAAHHAVASLFEDERNGGDSEHRVYCYRVRVSDARRTGARGVRFGLGSLEVRSDITWTSGRFSYAVLHMGDHHLVGGVRPFEGTEAYTRLQESLVEEYERGDTVEMVRILYREFQASTYSLHSLFQDEQERVVTRILADALTEAEETVGRIYETRLPLMRFLASLEIAQPGPFRAVGEFILTTRLERSLAREHPDMDRVEELFHEARLTGVRVDRDTLRRAVGDAVHRLLLHLEDAPRDPERLRTLRRILDFTHSLPFHVDLWRAQNVYFRILSGSETGRVSVDDPTRAGAHWSPEFLAAGRALGLAVSPELDEVSSSGNES